jgi:hypothetical protein
MTGRCSIALPPRTAGALWRRTRIPWRRLIAAMADRYRPERHYMRGPGPKCRERQDRAREAPCARAGSAEQILSEMPDPDGARTGCAGVRTAAGIAHV